VVNLVWIVAVLLTPLVWLVPFAIGAHEGFAPLLIATLSGLAIVGAAFQLSWACELAEEDVPPAFALILLALIAVLPEYAVDMYFAYAAGRQQAGLETLEGDYREYAIANMTGANRVLIGIGWSMLAFVQWFRMREKTIAADPSQRLELGILLWATMYSFALPLKGQITFVDTALLFGIFGYYVFRGLKAEHKDEDPVGPAAWIHERTSARGRWAVIAFFLVYACFAIWFSAHHFADGLVIVGRSFKIDEFVLIQIVAPLASESPEFIVAALFVARGRSSKALAALVSSTVNQWTLLVGALPIAYSLGAGEFLPLEFSERQREELLLTSAQSLFAIAVLSDLTFGVWEAVVLVTLFSSQFVFPSVHSRYALAGVYLLLTVGYGLRNRHQQREFLKMLRIGR
jgi:cation:H+ antiporter